MCISNKLILIFIFLSNFTFSISAQSDSINRPKEEIVHAENVSVRWFTLLSEGRDLDSLIQVSEVPFALDGKKILYTKEELKSFYNQVIVSKGSRNFSDIEAKVYSSKQEIIEDCIPINVIILKITVFKGNPSGESVLVSVRIVGDDFKVVGFKD